MEQSFLRTYASVDLSAIRKNYEAVRSLLRPGCKILSVVKADGYGHGAVPVARTLSDSDYFGVACLEEALELRQNGISAPILILGYTEPAAAPILSGQNLTQCAFSREYLLQLQKALKNGQTLKIHLKIDTGMSRLGFYVRDEVSANGAVSEISEAMKETPSLEYEGIFTHFTSSETPDKTETEEQFAWFCRVLDGLKELGITFPLRHCANSGASLQHPETHLDMVRPGIVLYGYAPDPKTCPIPLVPAMELKARVAQIHTLAPGDTVSYNRTYRAERTIKTATVCLGYGDGLHRSLSNGGPVLVNGKRAAILGRVCMDQCVLDVTGIDIAPGDTVTFMGRDGSETLTAEDLAEFAGTICYEILCSLGKRIPRIYEEI